MALEKSVSFRADHRAPNAARVARAVHFTLGLVGCSLLAAQAFAQAPAPAPTEPEPAAPAEPAPTDPAADPAAPAAAGEAPAAEASPDAVDEMPIDDASLEVDEPATPGERGLDEVVVTVDRRKKDLQDYSGVAASFSESKLASVGITNARDMATQVPGMQIGVQEGNTEIYIRGVGSDNNTELGDPAVALHVDGVYIPRPRGVGSMFFDIERVEVNSGPQGTLRGRNAMGGAVNIVSKRPKLDEFDANAEATFGTYATRRYQGMVNIPVGSKLALRVAGFSDVHDPYWENAGPLYDIRPAEDADSYALRAQLLYQPTERFSILLGYDYTAERGTGYLGANFYGQLTQVDRTDPFNPVAIPFDVNAVDNPRRTYLRGMNPHVEMWHAGYRAEINYDAGPVIFQAIGSYRSLRYQQVTGANAGAVTPGYDFTGNYCEVPGEACLQDTFTNGFWDSRSQSFIGELRAFAPDNSRLRWTAGGFYFNENQQVFLGQVSDPAGGFGGGEFNMPKVDGGSIAGYLDATFDVVETFRVLGGIRYTHETKSRTDGLWALWQGFPNNPAGPRLGTEGFQYEGLNRANYNFAATGPNGTTSTEDRVNLFLDGVKSFGARDTIPQQLCNDPPTAGMGETQLQRVIPNPDGPGMRCAYGVKSNPGIVNAVPQNNDVKNNFFDWRAGVEFDATKDSLLYFTVTTGHKAGGFNDTAPGTMPGELYDSYYDPESVLAFELGSKNQFFERNLRLNASAFMYRYENMVFQTIVGVPSGAEPDGGGDMGNMVQGAPNSAVRQNTESTTPVYGLDIDATLRLPAGLEAEAHVLFMDAKFPDGTSVNDSRISATNPALNYEVDLSGNWLPRVSAMTLNLALSQLIFSEVGSFDWVLQSQTKTQSYMSVYNGEGEMLPPAEGTELPAGPAFDTAKVTEQRLTDVVPAYTHFDIGAGWKHPDGRISISGYVNNVLNIAYTTSIISTAGLNLRFYNPPRTAGVRFRVQW